MRRRIELAAKRCFDVVVATAGLLVMAPILLVVALVVRRDGGPVLYRGIRAGQHGQPFAMLKVRTMVVNADRVGSTSTSDEDVRLTRVGRHLRRWKLDELPQLVNVLRGEMSIVGPRPQVLDEVERYTPSERRLLEVRPGITDRASIRFRDEGAILAGHADVDEAYARLIRPEKMAMSLRYVEEWTLAEDFRIVVATLRALLLSDTEPAPTRFEVVTERPTTGASEEQLAMAALRYGLVARAAAGKRLLEVGCGTAYGLDKAARATAMAAGIDISLANLSSASRSVPLVTGDAAVLPIRGHSVDVVAALEVVYYFADHAAVFNEAARVLAPGGELIMTLPDARRPGFSPSPYSTNYPSVAELHALAVTNGFDPIVYGAFSLGATTAPERIFELVRRTLVRLHLMPRTLRGRERLKRLAYWRMTPLRDVEPDPDVTTLVEVSADDPVKFRQLVLIARRCSIGRIQSA